MNFSIKGLYLAPKFVYSHKLLNASRRCIDVLQKISIHAVIMKKVIENKSITFKNH